MLLIKEKYRQRILIPVIMLLAGISMISCSNSENENDPKIIAEEHNAAKFSRQKEKDANFIADLAEISLLEIELAKLAQNRGNTKEVQEMGKKLQEVHSKNLAELKQLAESKSITIPDSLSKKWSNDQERLRNKSGDDFDKSFCKRIAEEHKTAIKKCETASKEADDIEIKNWAYKSLPDFRKHLDQAMTCEEKYN